MLETLKFTAGADDAGRRIDRVVRRLLHDLPLSAVYRLFRTGAITIADRKVRPEALIRAGDSITIVMPYKLAQQRTGPERPSGAASQHEKTGLDYLAISDLVILETSDLLLINKPKGLLTHGPSGLDQLVSAAYMGKVEASLAFRPAPLHRLDRNTSGIVAVSTSITGARLFSAALRAGRIKKHYVALLDGHIEQPLRLDNYIWRNPGIHKSLPCAADTTNARRAITTIVPFMTNTKYTLASLSIGTGITHQIRTQCAACGHPLSGDMKYGGSPQSGGYLLHCACLEFPPELTNIVSSSVEAPLPEQFCRRIVAIFGPSSLDSIVLRRYP
jgi:23S rRNA pseudouridine955/2504/2580 synthase